MDEEGDKRIPKGVPLKYGQGGHITDHAYDAPEMHGQRYQQMYKGKAAADPEDVGMDTYSKGDDLLENFKAPWDTWQEGSR